MTLFYDEYDDEHPIKSSHFFKRFKYFLGFSPLDDEDFVPFECAGVLWGGYTDGSVNIHPICKLCHSQLSFIDKDTIMCDKCHKLKVKVDVFHFIDKGQVLRYQEAYEMACALWKQKMRNRKHKP